MPDFFFKNIFYAVFGNTTAAIISLFFVIFYVNVNGIESFGVYSFYQTILMVTLVGFKPNVWQAFISFINKDNLNVSQRDSLRVIFFTLDLFYGVVACGFSFLLLSFFVPEFNFIYFIPFYLFALNGFLVGYLRSEDKFHIYAFYQVLSSLVKLLILIIFPGLDPVELINKIFLCDGILWLLFYLYGLFPIWDKIKKMNLFSLPFYKFVEIIRFSLGTHLTALIDLPVAHLDKLVVGSLLSDSLLGVYTLLKRIALIFSVVIEPISQVLLPLFVSNSKDKNKVIYAHMTMVLFIGSIGLCFTFFSFDYFNATFLNNVLENHFQDVIFIISIQVLALLFTWIHPLIIALGLIGLNNKVTFVANAAYIMFLALLTDYYGMTGAVLALAIQYFIVIVFKFFSIVKVGYKVF